MVGVRPPPRRGFICLLWFGFVREPSLWPRSPEAQAPPGRCWPVALPAGARASPGAASSGHVGPVPLSPGMRHHSLASPVCPEPLRPTRAERWGSSLEASELSFPVTQPSSRVSGLGPGPAPHASVWARTRGQGSSLPRSKAAWPRDTVPRAGGEVGGLPPFSPAALLPPAGHPHAPRSLPLPAQAPLHRALVLACF